VKAIFRSAWFQAFAGWLTAAYLGFTLGSIRWRYLNREAAETIWDDGGPTIVCFWHSRISMSPACWDLKRAQVPRALISHSHDGEITAQAMERLGFPAIRGSAAKTPDKARKKGGAAAFREIVRWLRPGHCVAIPPDGPNGPVEQMTDGPAMLARLSKAHILFVGFASKPCLHMASWDHAVIPLPFARGVIAYEIVPRVTAADDLETVRLDWTARLSALTRRAEAAVA
jgi:lysophospholipid acyltransferase (LPLAT)-like uncharacterized protein